MKRFATITAIAALLGTGALANDNEIFVDQSGSNNYVGDANNPVEQFGTSNLMDFTQSGSGNAIGSKVIQDPGLPAGAEALQRGANHEMTVIQSGHRNSAEMLRQRDGDQNELFIRQGGNDNRIEWLSQRGDRNLAEVRQGGNENRGYLHQTGDFNITDTRQGGDRNRYRIIQGSYSGDGKCMSCDIDLSQSGNDNYANLSQHGNNQMATISQGGNGNSVYTHQSAN